MVDLNGVNCLLMTPFDNDGKVDFNSLAVVAVDVIKGGVNSVVGNGKIGEFEVLTPGERREIIDMLVSYVGGKVPVGFGIINATYECSDCGAFYVARSWSQRGNIVRNNNFS